MDTGALQKLLSDDGGGGDAAEQGPSRQERAADLARILGVSEDKLSEFHSALEAFLDADD